MTDPANRLNENDGLGNTNSVYYVPNKQLFLKGYQSARTVEVTGSFNNWAKEGLPLERTDEGWRIALYLEKGTHRYQFLVDGRPVKENDDKAGNEQKLALGNASSFVLKGFPNARQVTLAGNFNDWKPRDIFMQPDEGGWRVSYVLGPGNYQYKFIVDGRWITDPANPNIVSDGKGNLNSFMVVAPNYTFRLKGHTQAKEVHLAGEFNNWSPDGLSMAKSGTECVCPVYLGRGKHLYKFIVDGKWMRDPDNPLWEDDDENSVLWIE
jgi:1,4-alpha-glucan branching enzyme